MWPLEGNVPSPLTQWQDTNTARCWQEPDILGVKIGVVLKLKLALRGSGVSEFYGLQEVAERRFENMCFTSLLPFITLIHSISHFQKYQEKDIFYFVCRK